MKVIDSRIITVQTKDANGAEILLKLTQEEAKTLRDELNKIFPQVAPLSLPDGLLKKIREVEKTVPKWPSTWPTYPPHKPAYPWEVIHCVSSRDALPTTPENAQREPRREGGAE